MLYLLFGYLDFVIFKLKHTPLIDTPKHTPKYKINRFGYLDFIVFHKVNVGFLAGTYVGVQYNYAF